MNYEKCSTCDHILFSYENYRKVDLCTKHYDKDGSTKTIDDIDRCDKYLEAQPV